MSSSPEADLANGDNSPVVQSPNMGELEDRATESDLSEVHDTTAPQHSPSPSRSASSNQPESPQPVEQEPDDSSDNDGNNASDDADFDMEDSPAPSQSDAPQDQRSTSSDSRRTAKRKAAAEEDEYIRENPELYGLRRSVCPDVAHIERLTD